MKDCKIIKWLAALLALLFTGASLAFALMQNKPEIFFNSMGSLVGVLFLTYIFGVWE